jgi:hypothetical protein
MRRTGRPPLAPDDATIEVTVRLPAKRYDALYAQARAERVSVSELMRRLLKGDFPVRKLPSGQP